MGYRWDGLDVLKAVPKPLLAEFGIHYRLERVVTRAKTPSFLYTGVASQKFLNENRTPRGSPTDGNASVIEAKSKKGDKC